MPDIAVTANARVRLTQPAYAEVYPAIAAEAIVQGQLVYQTPAGKMGVADANVAGRQQVRGLALQSAAANKAFDVVKCGHVSGFTLPQAYDTQVFLSDTAGAVGDGPGTMAVPVGRVVGIPDNDNAGALTKLLFIDVDWSVQRV
jgi:hypothetical protein